MNSAGENPYQSFSVAHPQTAALAEEWERAAFIRRTYAHLAGAIMLFVTLEALIFALVPTQQLAWFAFRAAGPYTWLMILGAFMVVSWIAHGWATHGASIAKQYFGLALYIAAYTVLFIPLLFFAIHYSDPSVLPSAGIITLGMFAGLTAVVFVTRKDFSFLRTVLVWGSFIALGLIVCAIVLPGGLSLGVWFSLGMIVLASGYILYDTSNILHHYRTDQHVAASLALFGSVAILFWYVLRLLMSSRD